MENRNLEDLVRIAAAGGGFEMDATRHHTDNLVRIVAAAQQHKARIHIRNTAIVSTDNLVRIAAAGQGVVTFAL